MIKTENRLLNSSIEDIHQRRYDIACAWREGFAYGCIYMKDELAGSSYEGKALKQELLYGLRKEDKWDNEINQKQFKSRKELDEQFANKPKLSELNKLSSVKERREHAPSGLLLNSRVERIDERRICCLVNFQGYPMHVSFPKSVLETHGLQVGDLFLLRPVMSREISSSDCYPLRPDRQLSEDDIEFIRESKRTAND